MLPQLQKVPTLGGETVDLVAFEPCQANGLRGAYLTDKLTSRVGLSYF